MRIATYSIRRVMFQQGFDRQEANAGGDLAQVIDAREPITTIFHRDPQPDVGRHGALAKEARESLGAFGQDLIGVVGVSVAPPP